MTSPFLRAKIDERAALTDTVGGILKKCSDETRDPSQEERAKLDEYGNRIKMLDGSISELRTAEEANARFLSTVQRMESTDEETERRNTVSRKADKPVALSAGEAFVQSDNFRNYRGFGTMEPVEFSDFLGVEQRAAISGITPITLETLDLPPYQWSGPAGATERNPFLSVIGREVVSSNAVSYISWSKATGAAIVAETDTKPEATLTPTETPLNLATYAFWKAISRQALEDMPRIRSIVETKLRAGLAATLEAAAVSVLDEVDAYGGDESGLAGIRAAIGSLQGSGYQPNAIVVNPADAATLDIAVMGATVSGPVSQSGYWGLRVVPVPGITAGTAYVGDFANGVTWFDRSSASVYMSDSHADYFVRNLFVVLAEQRSAFALTEPDAVQSVSVAAAAAGSNRAATATATK